MLAVTRAVEIPARYGGDEFCIIMPRTERSVVGLPLKRLMAEFDARREHAVTFSIGVVQTGPDEVDDPRELIRQADEKMYQAKDSARSDGGHHIQL